jgi:hypothetical protein
MTDRELHLKALALCLGMARAQDEKPVVSFRMKREDVDLMIEHLITSPPTAPALTAGEREALAALQDYLDTYVTYSSHPVALHLDTLTRLFARCVVREGEG